VLFLSDYKQLFKEVWERTIMIDYEARLERRIRILKKRGVKNVHFRLGLNSGRHSDQEIARQQWARIEAREYQWADPNYSK
tara:strand:+ start:442 stop:684 length:243 start_codon:yes stop_codon:yes gene_type:complete